MKKCAIVQSSYIPWRGYFDLINFVDEFILLDDVQYTKRDWRNRNQIKTATGLQWLTIPTQVKSKFTQLIKDTLVCNDKWTTQHWRAIELSYRRAPYFTDIADKVQKIYSQATTLRRLSDINYLWIKNICNWLNIDTKLNWSMQYKTIENDKNQRLIQLCLDSNSTYYLSGPSAKAYIDTTQFLQHGISVEYISYNNYPDYIQRFHGFEPSVSILDLLFNVGTKHANCYMKSF